MIDIIILSFERNAFERSKYANRIRSALKRLVPITIHGEMKHVYLFRFTPSHAKKNENDSPKCHP